MEGRIVKSVKSFGAAAALLGLSLSGIVAPGSIAAAPTTRSGNGVANTWEPTGSMAFARSGQTATLLTNSEVLIAGGGTATAELYDASTGTWTQTGTMSVARTGATATLLGNGQVLVVGGCCNAAGNGLTSAELYNPATGAWTLTGSLSTGRFGSTATLLSNRMVLVAGGACARACGVQTFTNSIASSELYDPTTGTWTSTGKMHQPRESHTATLLPDGEVLVAGGLYGCDDQLCTDNSSTELYNPATGKWSLTGSMHEAREQQTASLLADGDVLIAGGLKEGGSFGNGTQLSLSTAELYDPTAGTWSTTASMAGKHLGQTATMLNDGSVLVAGGGSATAELFEPGPAVWVSPGALLTPRTTFTATLLPDGTVLAAGGDGPDGQPLASAERYMTGRGPLVRLSATSLAFSTQLVGGTSPQQQYEVVNEGTANLIASGVAIQGANPSDFHATTTCAAAPVKPGKACTVTVTFAPTTIGPRSAGVALVDNAPLSPQSLPVSGFGSGPFAWAPTGSMTTARESFAAALLSDSDVLVAGGHDGPLHMLASAELWSPSTGTWRPTGAMQTPRAAVHAVTLSNGDVLVAGGLGQTYILLSSAELYDPTTGGWTPTGSMNATGENLTETLLPDGDVLATGQWADGIPEVYNPTTGTWKDTGPTIQNQPLGSAILLQSGLVLVVGGGTAAAELYHPASNTWSATGSMGVARTDQMTAKLANGFVLVAGGIPSAGGPSLTSAELYDPATGTWSPAEPMFEGRFGGTASPLPDGSVLVTGGCDLQCSPKALATTEFYSPATGYWSEGDPMTMPRESDAAVVLGNGGIIAVGGASGGCCADTRSAEVFTPALLGVSPSHGVAGQSITLSGSGFDAGELVIITWDGHPLGGGSTTTSSQGTFVIHTSVPSSAAPGAHQLTATGNRSHAGAVAAFEVTALAGGGLA